MPMFNTSNTGPAFGGGGGNEDTNRFQTQGAKTIQAQLGGSWERDAKQIRTQTRSGGNGVIKPTSGGGAEVIQFPTRNSGAPSLPSQGNSTPTMGGAVPGQMSPGAVIAFAGTLANEDTYGANSGGGKLGEAGEQGFGEVTPPPKLTSTGSAGSEWASPYTSGPGGGSTGSPLPPPMPPSYMPPPKSPKVTKKSSITTPMLLIGAVVLAKLLKLF